MPIAKHREAKTAAKGGRPRTGEVNLLRTRVWYLAVKARGEWTDYMLDIEFAREAGEPQRKGCDRIRAFERVRLNGSVPSSGNHPNRKFDLVKRVESHRSFKGTASYFLSPFWSLLLKGPQTIPEAHATVKHLLKSCKVHRPCFKTESRLREDIAREYCMLRASKTDNSHRLYTEALNRLVAGLPNDLHTLALIGALFREAHLTTALGVAIILARKFRECLDNFYQQDWLDEKTRGIFWEMAMRRMINWQMDEDMSWTKCYDDWPSNVVERPLMNLRNSKAKQYIAKAEEIWQEAVLPGDPTDDGAQT